MADDEGASHVGKAQDGQANSAISFLLERGREVVFPVTEKLVLQRVSRLFDFRVFPFNKPFYEPVGLFQYNASYNSAE